MPQPHITESSFPAPPGYKLLSVLGHGGQSIVYKAQHLSTDRLVAVKMLRDGILALPEHQRRLRREAEAITLLQHPNIVQILEVGTHQGQPFIVLEYIAGGSLEALRKQWPVPHLRAAKLLQTLAETMHFVHVNNIIHRDLKPANILLAQKSEIRSSKSETNPKSEQEKSKTENSKVSDLGSSDLGFVSDFELRISDLIPKITDFGLAKQADDSTSLTNTGAILGSLPYMTPEQADGRTKQATPAMDIYALGAILYDLLTGRPPFSGTLLEVLDKVRFRPPPPLPAFVPRSLARICMKCLEKQPQQRYQTAEELADELKRFQESATDNASTVDVIRPVPSPTPQIPGYDVLHSWGNNGIADVYKVRQTALERLAVLKVFTAEYAEPTMVRRVLAATRAVANLSHPHVVSIYDCSASPGQMPYVAEELVGGGDLAQMLDGKPTTAAFAAELLETLARTVHQFHQHQIIHRNLHPGTVLMTRFGTPKITGFYVAKLLQEPSHQEEPDGTFVGTMAWAAPEQAMGHMAAIGPATDIYALGNILYLMLTGRPPFEYKGPPNPQSAQITPYLMQLATTLPELPRKLQPQVPPALEAICLKCLAKDPQSRYASAKDLADELRKFLVAPVETRASVPEIVLPTLTPSVTEIRRLEGHLGWVWSVALSPEGKHILSGGTDSTMRLWSLESGAMVKEYPGFKRTVQAASFTPDSRQFVVACGEEIQVREVGTGKEVRRLMGHYRTVRCLAVSPNGRLLATGSTDGTVRLWNLATGELRFLFTDPKDQVNGVAFSADGQLLVAGGHDAHLYFWHPIEGKLLRRMHGRVGSIWAVDFSSDGQHVAFGGDYLRIKNWAEMTAGHVIRAARSTVICLAYAPDGQSVLTGCENGTICWWHAPTGRLLQSWQGHLAKVCSLALAPSGRLAVTASGDKSVRVWSLPPMPTVVPETKPPAEVEDKPGLVRSMAGHGEATTALEFTAEGDQLVSCGYDRCIRFWDIASGQEIRSLEGHSEGVNDLRLSPDQSVLLSASQDGTLRLWDVDSGQETARLHSSSIPVNCLAFAEEQPLLASGGDDRLIRLWHVPSRQELRCMAGHTDEVWCLTFAPEGRQLASCGADGTVRLWNTETGQEIRRFGGWFSGHRAAQVQKVAFSPDGAYLASGDLDGCICLWDPATGRLLRSLRAHNGMVSGLAFLPESGGLLSTGKDHCLRLWNLTTGTELRRWQNEKDEFYSLAVSRDGRYAATGSLAGAIRLWRLPSCDTE
jgi:WD40 repeat protein/tRNA A-37 threonylcarbamoyl transferase component Bud32